jgi:hypothetical protein
MWNPNMDEVFIDLGLSNLLGLLGTAGRGVAVQATGSASNTLVNGLSDGLADGH